MSATPSVPDTQARRGEADREVRVQAEVEGPGGPPGAPGSGGSMSDGPETATATVPAMLTPVAASPARPDI